MRIFGNLFWHVCLGFLVAGMTFLLGVLLTGTVVAAPIGLGLIQFSKFLMAPFSRRMIRKSSMEMAQNRAWLAYSWLVTILYFPFGLLATGVLLLEVAWHFITIIGIPIAIVLARSLGTYLNPVNKICVTAGVAEELARRSDLAFIERNAGPGIYRPAGTAPAAPAAPVAPVVLALPAALVAAAPAPSLEAPAPEAPQPAVLTTVSILTTVGETGAQAVVAAVAAAPAPLFAAKANEPAPQGPWLSDPRHAAQAGAWALFGLAVVALVFAMGRTAVFSWPFWLSLAIMPPACFVALRGERTQGIILLCAGPLLAFLFTMRGVVDKIEPLLPSPGPGPIVGPINPAPSPTPAPEPSPSPAPLPPPPTPAPGPLSPDRPAAQVVAVRVETDDVHADDGTISYWVVGNDGTRVKLTSAENPGESSISFGGAFIAINYKANTQQRKVRVFRQREGLRYVEMLPGGGEDGLTRWIAGEAGLPEGAGFADSYLDIIGWDAPDKLLVAAFCRTRGEGGYILGNFRMHWHLSQTSASGLKITALPLSAYHQKRPALSRILPGGEEQTLPFPLPKAAPGGDPQDDVREQVRQFVTRHHAAASSGDLRALIGNFGAMVRDNGKRKTLEDLASEEKSDFANYTQNRETIAVFNEIKIYASGAVMVSYDLQFDKRDRSGRPNQSLWRAELMLAPQDGGWRIVERTAAKKNGPGRQASAGTR